MLFKRNKPSLKDAHPLNDNAVRRVQPEKPKTYTEQEAENLENGMRVYPPGASDEEALQALREYLAGKPSIWYQH